MSTTTHDQVIEHGTEQVCESCARAGEVTVAFPDTTFTLCVRCVPAELRPGAVPLPGVSGAEELLQVLPDAGVDALQPLQLARDEIVPSFLGGR
jgi:hypothetical protein